MTNRFKTVLETRGPAVRRRLTADVLDALPFASTGQYIVRDTELKGFFVQVGKRSKTLMLQADLRQHGTVRSRRWKLGQHPDTRIRDARIAASEWIALIRRGIDPSDRSPSRRNKGWTLRDAWESYQRFHLEPLERQQSTVAEYRDNVERVLKEWIDIPLVEVGGDRTRVAELHRRLTKERGPYAANRAIRVFRAVYNHAMEYRPELPKNPAARLRLNK
ncbi:MAG: integrase arm-type DNA-binding domain-containing protein, partial [Microvirga sp.]